MSFSLSQEKEILNSREQKMHAMNDLYVSCYVYCMKAQISVCKVTLKAPCTH